MSVELWSSAAWRAEATAWLDERLAEAGLARAGAVQQPHLRPWATVLRAETNAGPVWLKAASAGTAFEADLYPALVRAVPAHVLEPLAVDRERAWILLPDGGPSLRERIGGRDLAAHLVAPMAQYGELQRALAPEVGALVQQGVPDMRPYVMPGRFGDALAAAGDDAQTARVAAMRSAVVGWCGRLAASPIPASLDHNDLHPGNILGGAAGPVRYYDWGDAVVAHPFAAMLVPLGLVPPGPGRDRVRDAYLDVFADLAPYQERRATLELACRIAKIARTLTWARALRTAREQGEPVDDAWSAAPRETLLTLLSDG
jgi:hypothetical protein